VRSLQKPLQLAFLVTKVLRTLVLFFMAASTFLLLVHQNKQTTVE
jgi:hypothetical protein